MVAEDDPVDFAPPPADLTCRQREILVLICKGMTECEMAEQLGIGRETVHSHEANLRRDLGLHKTAQLVRYAIRWNLVKA